MSGYVGILSLDGALVDRGQPERMTRAPAFRGPDAQETVLQGPFGLGLAMLRVMLEAGNEIQPLSLHDSLYLVADCWIDARTELIEKLQSRSRAGLSLTLSTPDPELILHAYDRRRDHRLEHLLGSFSFAIWDSWARGLFCAHDQMGVKPFYYALVGKSIIFSSTLKCLRLHPAVSSRLNDPAIPDFPFFDGNQESSTTSLADVQRLPPAQFSQSFPEDLQSEAAQHTARAIRLLELHGPTYSNCLERSMRLWRLLRRDGVDAQLHIGVRKEGGKFEARASVELHGQVLNDGADELQHYARFDAPLATVAMALSSGKAKSKAAHKSASEERISSES